MSTRIVSSIAALRETLAGARRGGEIIGLVPTMGALHAGHGRLIERAVQESDLAIISIFVNPTQFNQKEDYEQYPQTLADDAAYCESLGVPLIFAPSVEEMYPRPLRTSVEVAGVSEHLCGQFRPGHFRGVATVVLKLFAIVQPDRAYFGEKDAQQLAVIRGMADDLNLPVQIVPVPIVREQDGLALSSRNRRLSPEQRQAALVLSRALRAVKAQFAFGIRAVADLKQVASSVLASEPLARVEYLEVVDADSMEPVARVNRPARAAGAIWVGDVRLIDNVALLPE
jgi:pantoate--beta-alanine ligase